MVPIIYLTDKIHFESYYNSTKHDKFTSHFQLNYVIDHIIETLQRPNFCQFVIATVVKVVQTCKLERHIIHYKRKYIYSNILLDWKITL